MKVFHADGTVDAPVDLTGKRVTIGTGLGSSVPNSSLIHSKTPELGDITEGKCAVRQEITDRKPDAAVAAYVDYEGGIFSPLAFQENEISFGHGMKWKTERCATCGTVLNVEVNSGKSIRIVVADVNDPTNKAKQTSYTVSATDIVVFRNAPPPGSASTGVSHFPHFYDLLEKNCPIKDDVKVSSIKCADPARCTDVSPKVKAIRLKGRTLRTDLKIEWSHFDLKDFLAYLITPDIECTNSHFP
jgi:hypothetical protein